MQVTSTSNLRGPEMQKQTSIMKRLQVNKKSAFLIIHTTQGKALQVATIRQQSKDVEAQFSAVNQNNSKQLWIIDERVPGFVELVSGFSDNVLTVDGRKVQVSRGKGKKSQLWVLEDVNGNIRISSAVDRKMYLCFQAFTKRPALKENAPDQWQFRKVEGNQNLNKTCFIFCPFTQKMIDIPECSPQQGQYIGVYTPNYRFNQRWRLHKTGDVYIIKSYINQMNLDVYKQEFEQGSRICQFHSTGGINQLWMLDKLENSTDSFRIYCFADPEYQLGHDGSKLKLKKGSESVWRIQGYIPE